MIQFKSDHRPSAEDVCERCSSLVDELGGETLRHYALRQNHEIEQNAIVDMGVSLFNSGFSVGSTLSLSSDKVTKMTILNHRVVMFAILIFLIAILVANASTEKCDGPNV